jgi:hypothetical protein
MVVAEELLLQQLVTLAVLVYLAEVEAEPLEQLVRKQVVLVVKV